MMPSNTHRNAENKADRLERTNAPIYQVLLEPRKHVQHKKMKLKRNFQGPVMFILNSCNKDFLHYNNSLKIN